MNDEVQLTEEIPFNKGSLSLWRNKWKMPRTTISVLESDDGLLIANKNFENFQQLLQLVAAEAVDQDMILRIFEKAAPPRRLILKCEDDFAGQPVPNVWHPPQVAEGKLIFFCNDYIKGRIEKISIGSTGMINVANVAKGIRRGLR